jgi:hypothetical protein
MAVPKIGLEELKKLGPEEEVVGVASGAVDVDPEPVRVTVSDEERRSAKDRLQAAGFFDQTTTNTQFQQAQAPKERKVAKEELSERNRMQFHKLLMME